MVNIQFDLFDNLLGCIAFAFDSRANLDKWMSKECIPRNPLRFRDL
jgi:hypothetical protein